MRRYVSAVGVVPRDIEAKPNSHSHGRTLASEQNERESFQIRAAAVLAFQRMSVASWRFTGVSAGGSSNIRAIACSSSCDSG